MSKPAVSQSRLSLAAVSGSPPRLTGVSWVKPSFLSNHANRRSVSSCARHERDAWTGICCHNARSRCAKG